MAFAPSVAALSTAVARLAKELSSASTSRSLHFGQIAEAMSRSSEISSAQPLFAVGYDVPPSWSTFLKHPFAVVHAASPYCERYTARSDSAFGSSKASTIAMVLPEPPLDDSDPSA